MRGRESLLETDRHLYHHGQKATSPGGFLRLAVNHAEAGTWQRYDVTLDLEGGA